MSWRLARSLSTLRSEIVARFPGTTVWAIGDDDHQSGYSDHNPNAKGVVCAIDVKGDGGMSLKEFVAHLLDAPHANLRYVIYSRKIYQRKNGFKAQAYTGPNAHADHVHVSVGNGPDGRGTRDYDSTAPWGVADTEAPKPSKPSTPAKPSTGKAAPTPHYAFPLPSGHYFGPKGGPNASVSGYYRRSFKGVSDRVWLKRWGAQLGKRGWNLKRHLPSGNDGFFGPEYRGLVEAFQRDQNLVVDGKIGPRTWKAAFENPVT